MLLRGLTIVVATADAERWASALTMAAAHAALGGATRLFLDSAAVALLAEPAGGLLATALDLGVTVIACQTGLAAAGLSMAALDARIEAGGMTSLLAALEEDRLVTI